MAKKARLYWLCLKSTPPDKSQDIPRLRIQRQQGALQLGRNSLMPSLQGLLGQLLQFQVHGRDDVQAALFDDVRAVPFDQLVADMGQIIGGFAGLDDRDALQPQLFFPRGR